MEEDDFLVIRFPQCSIRYTKDFEVVVSGTLYKRQLAAVNEILTIYMEQVRLGQEFEAKEKKVDGNVR